MQERLIKRASELLSDGTVDRVAGWKAGEFFYDVSPAVFTKDTVDELLYNSFCGANQSKFLVGATAGAPAEGESKLLALLKPCDTYSLNQLLTEHRLDREKVYAVGVPCHGMIDVSRVRELADGIRSITVQEETVTVETLYDGEKTAERADLLCERCKNCKSKKHVAYDELLGDEGEVMDSHRFDEVERLEAMTAEERYAFWQGELSRCIRCNACRDVCPACTCEKCVFDNPSSGVENKAAADSFEEKMFHIIRAFHVAGRCTDCGECSRVCPQHIPLHLLNRKFIHDMDRFYGAYQAGAEVGSRAPVVNYTTEDIEPRQAVEGECKHA